MYTQDLVTMNDTLMVVKYRELRILQEAEQAKPIAYIKIIFLSSWEGNT